MITERRDSLMQENMKKPLVSIIVPVYNTAAYLPQCLESLIQQRYDQIEILLINDGSTDGSRAICKTYRAKDSRIQLYEKENEGHMKACRDGFEKASGEYVMFVDSDDWIEPNTIELCIRKIEEEDSDCVLFSYQKEYDTQSIANPIFPTEYSLKMETELHRRMVGPIETELRYPHRIDNPVTLWGKLYRKNVVNQGRFISERVTGTADDVLFNIYALRNCKRISYIDQCLYHYRKTNASSITSKHQTDLAEKWEVLYDMIEEELREEENPPLYWEAYYNRISCGFIGLGLNLIRCEESIHWKAEKIKEILQRERYREAMDRLKIQYMPIHWRIFFRLCRHPEQSLWIVLLFYGMDILRRRG